MKKWNDLKNIFLPHSGAGAFFLSIIVWGVGIGCFAAAMNNFLADIQHMDSAERGWLEFFRELPGLALVFILALLHRMSNWKIMRLGTLISLAGAGLLLIPADKIFATAFIMIWSLGEHLVMPVRSVIAMQVAKPGCAGRSLGMLTSAMNFGTVSGSLLVALIFYVGHRWCGVSDTVLFNVLWGFIMFLMLVSVISTFSKDAPNAPSRRPRLYFRRKFTKFYALELFYGARKQIFLTFAPYVLISSYGFKTDAMAFLMGACAFVNIFAAPAVGKITDKLGYRTVMIYDTVILFFVCLLYGFAGDWFSGTAVVAVLCLNFLLDAVISTTSLATNIYVKTLAENQDELTATLSTGISINHLISIIAAPLGGYVWIHYGVGVLFSFSAVMAILNSLFAATLPKPQKTAAAAVK
ncbi:MAG: MFS transporter [Lentisphaeria bacterium]|nr:MFS transporter [Lentisphaeria bacterium]